MNLKNHWVIGDVHGCIHTLEKLIKKLPKDSVSVFVGDLVDRGIFSKYVIMRNILKQALTDKIPSIAIFKEINYRYKRNVRII